MTERARAAREPGRRIRRGARWLPLATVVLILYGSLFPFQFADVGELGIIDRLATLKFQPASRGDLAANLLLYMPLGFCLMARQDRRRRGAALACSVVAGMLLSVGVEILQIQAASRVPSLTDVAVNAVGTFTGGFAAAIYFDLGISLRVPGLAAGRPEAAALGLVLLWLAFRLAPFVPSIDWQEYKEALKPVFLEPQIGPLDTLRYLAGWLVVFYGVRVVWPREQAVYAFLAIAGMVLAGGVVIVDKALVAPELVALVLCIPLAAPFVASPRRQGTALVLFLVAATIVIQGLKPFALLPQAQPFNWVPFHTSLSGTSELNYSVLLEKCFWYFSLVWLLTRRGVGIPGAAVAVSVLLGAIELMQRWLPGRSAEITDPLLALMAGGLLSLLGTSRAGSGDATVSVEAGRHSRLPRSGRTIGGEVVQLPEVED